MKRIFITIDCNTINEYCQYYFSKYPRRKKPPIEKPISISLNQWMVMPRHQMNNEKQIWKEFIVWLVGYCGYSDLGISKCNVTFQYFFGDKKKRDADNYVPKNIFDGFTASGLLIGDDFSVVESLTIKGGYSKDNPRTEITIYYEEE